MRTHQLFAGAGGEAAYAIAGALRPMWSARETTIYHQGGESPTVYFLAAGCVRLGHLVPDGRELPVAMLLPGDFFGDEALFVSGATRVAHATCIMDTRLYECRVETVRHVIERNARFAGNLAHYLQTKRHDALMSIEAMAFLSVRERIIWLMERLAAVHGNQTPDGGSRIAMHLTRTQIALLIGSTRETVTTEISGLVRSGRLEAEHGHFTLPARSMRGNAEEPFEQGTALSRTSSPAMA